MADRFYGIPISGSKPADVTEQATTTSAVVELRVNDTVYGTKQQVLNALQGIMDYIVAKETNPIA